MGYKIKEFINTKQFHICMIAFMIFFIVFVVCVISLIYTVEGEVNIPFKLSQVSIISEVEGTDIEDTNNKWNLKVNQNNDFYLYIKKDEQYEKGVETIKSIVIDNFIIEKEPNIGELKLFRPDSTVESAIFKNTQENQVSMIEYQGSLESSIKDLKISNQGGLVAFRYVIDDIGSYISNEDEEINHSELLKKIGINNDDLKCKLKFDISINLDSNKTYKTTFDVELPINNVVDNGTQSQEYTDLKDVVFKRK